MSFTPGPWTFRKARSGADRWWVEGPTTDEGKRWYVAETAGRSEQNEANARLIAAAPDLLDAAQHLGDTGHRFGSIQSIGCDKCTQAQSAIMKAEGR